MLPEKKLKIWDSYSMIKTEATTNFKLKLVLLEIKSAEESKNVLHLQEKPVLKATKLILLEKTLITFSMN